MNSAQSPSWSVSLRKTAILVYVTFIIILLGYAVGFAAHEKMLVRYALPLSAATIAAFFWLSRRAEIIAWAALTAWLGMTYAHTGGIAEIAVFFLYVALAGLGMFRSPWFIAVPWFAHIAWDFLPRSLPEMYHELPVACMYYDGLIGLYLAWGAWKRRWPCLASTEAAAVSSEAARP